MLNLRSQEEEDFRETLAVERPSHLGGPDWPRVGRGFGMTAQAAAIGTGSEQPTKALQATPLRRMGAANGHGEAPTPRNSVPELVHSD